jgi:hypothetical protein
MALKTINRHVRVGWGLIYKEIEVEGSSVKAFFEMN